MAAVALAVLGEPDALRPAFRHQADPRLRTATIQKIATLRLAPRVLTSGLPGPGARRGRAPGRPARLGRDAPRPAHSGVRAASLQHARGAFLDDPDPGVHSAAELLIRRWEPGRPLALPTATPAAPPGPHAATGLERRAQRAHAGLSFRGPLVFRMGSPERRAGAIPLRETLHIRRIDRSLVVATTEATVKQYRAFKPDH